MALFISLCMSQFPFSLVFICHSHILLPILPSSIQVCKETNQSVVFSWTVKNMLYNISDLVKVKVTETHTSLLILAIFSNITMCPIMPQFIISMQELYDYDIHHSCQGVDTRFSVLLQSIASQNMPLSSIVFKDVSTGQDKVVEGDANKLEII